MTDVLVVVGVGGMGEAIARRLGSGKRVVIADYNKETLDRVGAALCADGYDVTEVVVDVSDRESLSELARSSAALGPIKQVAHTAGVSGAQAPCEAIWRVDLVGVAHSLDVFGEVIAAGGSGVYIASMAGAIAAPTIAPEIAAALADTPSSELLDLPVVTSSDAAAAYAIAKRANQLRVQRASVAWGKKGARVNSVSPGVISTPMGQQELAAESGQLMRTMISSSGTGRIGTPADIAAAVEFLLGPDSTFITGTDLLVDGGVVAALQSGALAL
ncbi:SDR family oxidoreductase [Mycobacterium sp. 48b]|uniref:SDR family oxidoreductase n=1 Tax=Mycobacterium sp. 48b TaxID=3400426 RepID=UPI003AB01C8B